MQGSVLWLILIYSCDLLHRRGTLWGSTTFCTMIEARCEAVSVSICHFVAWLLIFILPLSICRSVAVFLFFSHSFSSYFSPSRCLPLPSLPSVSEPNPPQSAITLPVLSHCIFTAWGQPVLPTFWQCIRIFVLLNRTLMSFQILQSTHSSPGSPFLPTLKIFPVLAFLPIFHQLFLLFRLTSQLGASSLIDRGLVWLAGENH